jgi:hypothetical protein
MRWVTLAIRHRSGLKSNGPQKRRSTLALKIEKKGRKQDVQGKV